VSEQKDVTNRYRLAFTEAEEALVARIDLRRSHANHSEARDADIATNSLSWTY
jgi:hypothetical protein